MHSFQKIINNQSGLTLAESLVSVTLAVILAGLAFPFCLFFGKMTNELLLTQELNQEAVRLSESLTRSVRKASGIAVADTITRPASDIDTSYVTVNLPNDTFDLMAAGKHLIRLRAEADPETLSSFLDSTQSHKSFSMRKGGANLDFNCQLKKSCNGKRYSYHAGSTKIRKRNDTIRAGNISKASQFQPLISATAPDPNEHGGGITNKCTS